MTAQLVAPIADSQPRLLVVADKIRASGQQPVYLTVKAPTRPYVFPVYAQLLQSNDALIVRSYGRFYVYPRQNVQVFFGQDTVPVEQLPTAALPFIENSIGGKQPGQFSSGDPARKTKLCPDCVLLLGYSKNVRQISARLNGKLDPWQLSPSYIPWSPPAQSNSAIAALSVRRPEMFSSCGRYGGYGFGNYGPDAGSSNCYSVPSYLIYYFTSSPCYRFFLSDRRSAADEQRRAADDRRAAESRLQALATAIEQHSVSDAAIDRNIDAEVQEPQRSEVKAIMLMLAPSALQHVAGFDASGHFFSNRKADYAAAAANGQWEQLGDNLWRKPNGETVALPKLDGPTAKAGTRSTSSAPCPAPGSSNTGGYVRGYVCNSPSRTFTTAVDTSLVFGNPGNSWCMVGANDDTGYLIASAWASNGTTAEGGLQWSPTYKNYAMYAKNRSDLPDNILNTWALPPGPTALTFTTYTSSQWSITASGLTGTFTWVHPGTSAVADGPLWTYKQATTIAQTTFNPYDGAFFGVGPLYAPLFNWSSQPGGDVFPDPTRGIRIGNNYGVNLHS